MSELEQFERIPPRDQVIFFVLDPTAGWNCTRINAINRAMSEVVFQLREIQDTCRETRTLKIAVLDAGNGVHWQSKMPVPVDEFEWEDLIVGSGPMNWELSLVELESQLSRNAMLHSTTGIGVPIIIFIANSFPCNNWIRGKEYLHNNKWFQHAIKCALTEDGSCADIFSEILATTETCYKLDEMSHLPNILPEVLRHATTIISIGPNPYSHPPRFWRKTEELETTIIDQTVFSDDVWSEGW